MATDSSEKADWREFERTVARIEAAAGPLDMVVKCPDRVRSLVTGRLREVDASIRMKMGTSDVLITIECRKRKPTQDVTWIEQLATKRQAIGAARTIAVSSNGFSSDAQTAAKFYGIDLRTISELSIESINQFLKIDFVLFTRRNCALAGVRARFFRGKDANWTLPSLDRMDWVAPEDVNPKTSVI